MAGYLCDGGDAASIKNSNIVDSKAFCEGMLYRTGGTALERPKTDNIHVAGTSAATAWDAGWDVADGAAGGAIAAADAGCCGLIGVAVSA